MNWILLVIAGLCECAFTFCLGKAKVTISTAHYLWLIAFLVFTFLSMYLLMRSTQHLPLSITYPVWTGIGAVGTVVLGICYFKEPASFWQLFFTVTLVISIMGIKIVSKS